MVQVGLGKEENNQAGVGDGQILSDLYLSLFHSVLLPLHSIEKLF